MSRQAGRQADRQADRQAGRSSTGVNLIMSDVSSDNMRPILHLFQLNAVELNTRSIIVHSMMMPLLLLLLLSILQAVLSMIQLCNLIVSQAGRVAYNVIKINE